MCFAEGPDFPVERVRGEDPDGLGAVDHVGSAAFSGVGVSAVEWG